MESGTGVSHGGTGIIAEARPSFTERFRISIALVAFVAWVLITSIDPFHTRWADGFTGTLTASPQWSILAAGLFLAILVTVCRWCGVALLTPISPRGLLILWLPAAAQRARRKGGPRVCESRCSAADSSVARRP